MIYVLIIGVVLVFFIITKVLRNRDDLAFLSLKSILALGVSLILVVVLIVLGVNFYKNVGLQEEKKVKNLDGEITEDKKIRKKEPISIPKEEKETEKSSTTEQEKPKSKEEDINQQTETPKETTNTNNDNKTMVETIIEEDKVVKESIINNNTQTENNLANNNRESEETNKSYDETTYIYEEENQEEWIEDSNIPSKEDTNQQEKPEQQTKPTEQSKPTEQTKPKPAEQTKPKPAEEKVPAPNNSIYFLNVGASTDSFIIENNGKYGLIDTSLKKRGSFIVSSLKKLGVKKLDFIIITHSHSDHIGGYEKVMKSFSVKRLYIKKDGIKDSYHKKKYKKMINIAHKRNTSICDVKQERCQNITIGNTNIKLYNTGFLNSKKISFINKGRFDNANSIVAVATIYGKKIYFAGDIGNYFGHNQESKVAKQIGDIDVYKAAHHGYITFNNHQDALNSIKPEYTVVTNTPFKSAIAIQRVKRANKNYKKTYYTVKGTVKLQVDEKGKLHFYQ